MVQQAPPLSSQPPDLPNMPGVSSSMSNYLRQFALWAKKGLDSKIEPTTALDGHLIQTYDTLPGNIPKVYKLQVSEAGVAGLAPIPLGKGSPGAPVPITGGSLPLAGGALTGPLTAPSATISGLLTVGGVTFSTLPIVAANDAAAATAGVPLGGVYRNGSVLMVRAV